VTTRWPLSLVGVLSLLTGGMLVALLVGLAVGGGADPLLLVDPGDAVRYGIPMAKALVHVGAALAVGSLMMAAFALSPRDPGFDVSLVVAAIGAALMTLASAASAFFTFLAIYLEPVALTQQFGDILWLFVLETEIGRAWLISTLLSAIVTVLALLVRSHTGVFFAGLVAVASLWPLAELGHAAGTANHEAAVSASFTHSVFAAMWVGGLAMVAIIGWMSPQKALSLPDVFRRFSTIALVSFTVVAISGATNAWLRVGEVQGLFTPYGALVVAKVVTLALLGTMGALYRVRLIRQLEGTEVGPTSITLHLVGAELALMGIATGLASALARTQTPVPQVPATEIAQATPAEILTGEPLPPEFTWGRVFTQWQFDVVWVLAVLFGILFYVWGHVRLAKRGDTWPISRTIMWVSGMVILGFSTNSGLAVYGTYLFSIHMVAHMLLSMAVPLLLVLSAPVTLASRAIAARKDGSRGPREWILTAVHSRYLAILGHPLVAAVIFAISLIVFYYSPLFEWALQEHLGHQWMILHFVFTGYLFAQSLVGVDPSPHDPPYPLRLIIVLATMAFHAFFGIGLIYGTGLLAPEWYGAMGREWGLDPLSDQQQGGELAWGLGEIPTLLLAIVVTWSWSKSDDRKNKRRDRAADRDGDRELTAYNEMLGTLAKRDQKLSRG
jgi:cytochrome c oxidase assembly factor CtaG/putative copper export protein